MDWGRKGKMDLGMEETDLRVLTRQGSRKPGGIMECGFIPWHSPSVLVWEGAGWSSPAPVDGSAASHGRTGQGRWIKTVAAKGEERRELASLHTVN